MYHISKAPHVSEKKASSCTYSASASLLLSNGIDSHAPAGTPLWVKVIGVWSQERLLVRLLGISSIPKNLGHLCRYEGCSGSRVAELISWHRALLGVSKCVDFQFCMFLAQVRDQNIKGNLITLVWMLKFDRNITYILVPYYMGVACAKQLVPDEFGKADINSWISEMGWTLSCTKKAQGVGY